MNWAKTLRKGIRRRINRNRLPPLFLPITRGPLHNFYHFFFGYFVPLYWSISTDPRNRAAVVEVAPHSPWLDLLPGSPPKRLDPLKAMKHALLAGGSGYSPDYRLRVFLGWDKWERFERRPLREISDRIVRETACEHRASSNHAEVVILLRNHVPDYFQNNQNLKYGESKRDIPNLHLLANFFENKFRVVCVDPGSMKPLEVVQVFSRAKLVVGQHGAGLTNIFFLPKNATVVELCWPDFQSTPYSPIYGLLSNRLGLKYMQLPVQTGPRSKVKLERLAETILAELNS